MFLLASTGRLEDRIRQSVALLQLVEIQSPAQGHFIVVETCQKKARGNVSVQAAFVWTAISGFVGACVFIYVRTLFCSLTCSVYFAVSFFPH